MPIFKRANASVPRGRHDGPQALVPPRSPAGPDAEAPDGQVQIIMDHDDVLRLDVVRRHELLHGFAGQVHKRHRQREGNGVPVDSTGSPLRQAGGV